jgi:hypothetical protein
MMDPDRKRAVETVLSILRHSLALLSRPDREAAHELARRFEITAVDLLDAATERSRQA